MQLDYPSIGSNAVTTGISSSGGRSRCRGDRRATPQQTGVTPNTRWAV